MLNKLLKLHKWTEFAAHTQSERTESCLTNPVQTEFSQVVKYTHLCVKMPILLSIHVNNGLSKCKQLGKNSGRALGLKVTAN